MNDKVTLEDLEAVDIGFVKSMEDLRTVDTVLDATQFQESFFETFTILSSDDKVVELLPGGAAMDVTFENRVQYCDLSIQVSACKDIVVVG